jgi:hypothetical protein
MTLNRWKVLACTLTVGVGGLAVFATDPAPTKPEPPKEPAALPNLTVKPATPPDGTDTPPPIVPVKGEDVELTIPIPAPTPAKPEETKKPDDPQKPALPVFEPIVPDVPPAVIPVKGETEPKDAKKPEPAKDAAPTIPEIKPPVKEEPKPTIVVPPVPPTSDKTVPTIEVPKPPAEVKLPEDKKAPEPVIAPPLKAETPPPPIAPEVGTKRDQGAPSDFKSDELPPRIKATKPEPTPTLATPVPTDAVKVPLTPGKPTDAAKLKLTLRMGDGEPRFEIRNSVSTDLLLKVYGQKIEMKPQPDAKASLAGVTAAGKVRFTAPGIEGTCDRLTIMSATGEVLLEGGIRLKTKHGKAWSEISSDKMVYQIGTSGLVAPGTPRVTPAGFAGE